MNRRVRFVTTDKSPARLESMKLKQKCQIERPEPGVLTYRKGFTEYRFPIYEEDREVVFVAWPSRQRLLLFFSMGGWTRVPLLFPMDDRERITAHVVEYLQRGGAPVRVLNRIEVEEEGLQFHPEFFECKARASEILDTAGFAWFSDYSCIDILHEEFGLEICGLREESSIEPITQAMSTAFPHWHHSCIAHKEWGCEPGWKIAIHMFPTRCGDACG
ncbi:MAG: hypothetical protein JWN25_1608 [Verrucomicrobiales bacterium]|nr:hypothetical protein [Verrucomicrobiales bacterium]